MKAVSARTGLSPHVIRVWESRYRAVEPARTNSNRRVYTEEEVERLLLLGQATRSGHSIGLIAGLSTDELLRIVSDDARYSQRPATTMCGDAPSLVVAGIEAVRQMDSHSLFSQLANAARNLGPIHFLEQVAHPLMQEIGESWHRGSIRVAEEHLATAVMHSFLGELKDSQRVAEDAPRIVVATPARQVHGLGALMVAIVAAVDGWHVIYLGTDLPADEIAYSAFHEEVRMIALSVVFPPDDPHLGRELMLLRRGVGNLPILIGGQSAPAYTAEIKRENAILMGNLREFSESLAMTRATNQQ